MLVVAGVLQSLTLPARLKPPTRTPTFNIYVETRLIYRLPVLPDESSIIVVNVHEQ
jgi:hypothetical protein